jgi:hypothetical protein
MKKGFVVFLSLLLLVGMVACGEKAEEDPYIPSTNTQDATSVVTIEEGNVVVRGESDYFSSVVTYVFEEGVYAYTLSETQYVEEEHGEMAYQAALDAGVYEEVVFEGGLVTFRADDSYMFEGMGLETAANYIAGSVIF